MFYQYLKETNIIDGYIIEHKGSFHWGDYVGDGPNGRHSFTPMTNYSNGSEKSYENIAFIMIGAKCTNKNNEKWGGLIPEEKEGSVAIFGYLEGLGDSRYSRGANYCQDF